MWSSSSALLPTTGPLSLRFYVVTTGDPSSWWPVAFHAETAFDMPGMIVLRRLREEFACSDPPGSRRMDPQETPARHDWLSSAMELRRIAAELEALARS
jgi:hypothetical protein